MKSKKFLKNFFCLNMGQTPNQISAVTIKEIPND